MRTTYDIYLINHFPDFNAPGFDIKRYNDLFVENNVIINAQSSNVKYDDHWGPLSLKCAFHGKEFYRTKNNILAVDDTSYLIFNEGKIYSSYIRSDTVVESLTVNFNPLFANEVISSVAGSHERNLEGVNIRTDKQVHFVEKLYRHNPAITPHLHTLRRLSKSLDANKGKVLELFHDLFVHLLYTQQRVQKEIGSMSPIRSSTKQELYKRLHAAKDMMDSCFHQKISLPEIAATANLQSHYFLRQFKKNFRVTPHQYLTERRLTEAKRMLNETQNTITDICLSVGFDDPGSFSKLFRSRFAVSPQQFRNSI